MGQGWRLRRLGQEAGQGVNEGMSHQGVWRGDQRESAVKSDMAGQVITGGSLYQEERGHCPIQIAWIPGFVWDLLFQR